MKPHLVLLPFISLLVSCAGQKQETAKEPESLENIPRSTVSVRQEVLAEGFQVPYAIEVIGENDFLITERMGGLYRYQEGNLTEIGGIPESTTILVDRHYGGVLDVSVHPRFDENQLVYLAYIKTDSTMSVIRFRLQNERAESIEEILSSDQFGVGARFAWVDNDQFFVTFGAAGTPFPIPGPQDLTNPTGKIFRLHADGSIPADNPVFPENPDALPGIWSYGHRDAQGLVYDKKTGILYANEHGPLGGDELNIIEKGGNYGWPRFSYGLNYDGSPVSDLTEDDAAEFSILPMKYWTPDFRLAPGSLLLLENSNFTAWNGSFLISGLAFQQLVRYDMEYDLTEIVLDKAGRIHDIAQLPSGDLVMLVDENSPTPGLSGRIVKLSPGE